MKNVYILYKNKTAQLESSLTKKEKTILEDYLIHLSGTQSPNKVKANKRFLLQFRDLIEKPLIEVKRKDLEGVWALIKVSQHEYNTKIMVKRGIKRFVKWYYRDLDLIENLEIGEFKPNRKKINKTTLLKSEEIKQMLHKANTLRDKALLILMYETAGRPQEIKDLRWKDISWDLEEVHLDSSKTERTRDIPIKESLIHLKRWRQEWAYSDVTENDFIFPSRWKDKNLTTEQLSHIVKKISNRAGIHRNITSYTLRHSRLSEIHKLGVKGIEHNKFAGHKEGSKQINTYVHLDNSDMKEEVLKKVYHIEEISENKKHQFEKQIEELNKKIENLEKDFLGKVLEKIQGMKGEEFIMKVSKLK